MNSSPKPRRWLFAIITTLWCLSMAVGATLLARYESTPAKSAKPAASWPTETALARSPEKFTLIMAVHPNCPCTRASLDELNVLLNHCPAQLTAYVLFAAPANLAKDSITDELQKIAATLPNTGIINDSNATIAQQFHAQTSGEVFLYDPAGQLRFSGGITSSRGHEGENDGRSAIESLIHTGTSSISSTPVFGCSIK